MSKEYLELKTGDMIILNPDNEIAEFWQHIYDGCFIYKEIKSGKKQFVHKDDYKQKVNYL